MVELGAPVTAVMLVVPMLVRPEPEPPNVVAVAVPLTCSAVVGLVVPMPTLPLSTTKAAGFVMVALVPAIGGPEISSVAALVMVDDPTNA